MLERNLKQAEVPDNCEILPNSAGTAAGMWFEKDDKVLIALPGVPHEMKTIMQEHGLIKIAHTFISETILHKTMLTAGVGESFIAEKIADIEQELPPYIKLAYLPEYGMVRLRLTAKGQDEVALYSALNKYFNAIINRLGMIVIAHEDLTMPQLVVRELIQRKKTIALAESCTGGLLGHLLTQEPGASAAFIGSVVAYSNEIKTNILKVKASTIQTYGVVSEPTVREMVHGILQEYQTDYGIAISGVLGPGGGTDRVQVGTVCIAVGNNERKFTKTFKFDKDRTLNKDLAAKWHSYCCGNC